MMFDALEDEAPAKIEESRPTLDEVQSTQEVKLVLDGQDKVGGIKLNNVSQRRVRPTSSFQCYRQ